MSILLTELRWVKCKLRKGMTDTACSVKKIMKQLLMTIPIGDQMFWRKVLIIQDNCFAHVSIIVGIS